MNEQQYGVFLYGGAAVCAAGCLLNLIRIKGRGNSALMLALAFLMMGGVLLLLRARADQIWVTIAGVAVAALLVGDFLLRSKTYGEPKQ